MAQVNTGMQLQRSSVSFRRQGSSGAVWDDKFLSGELASKKSGVDQSFRSGEDERLSRRNRSGHLSIGTGKGKIRAPRPETAHQEVDGQLSPQPSGCCCCGGLRR